MHHGAPHTKNHAPRYACELNGVWGTRIRRAHHMRWDTKLETLNYLFFNISLFFLAQVCSCHFTVAASFLMILGALKTSAQRRFHVPKIIHKLAATAELWLAKEHHVEGILRSAKSPKISKLQLQTWARKKEKCLKKGSWGSPIWCPISYDELDLDIFHCRLRCFAAATRHETS